MSDINRLVEERSFDDDDSLIKKIYNHSERNRDIRDGLYKIKKTFRDSINGMKDPIPRTVGHIKGAIEDVGHNLNQLGSKASNILTYGANKVSSRVQHAATEYPTATGAALGLIGAGLAARKFAKSGRK